MSNQQGRRTSKRLAAAADIERDDDFQFVRKSKRPKTEEPEPKPAKKATARGLSSTTAAAAATTTVATTNTTATAAAAATTITTTTAEPVEQEQGHEVSPLPTSLASAGRRISPRRKGGDAAAPEDGAAARKPLRKSTRGSAAEEKDQAAAGRPSKPARRWEPSPTPRRPATESAVIALPMNDTPVINRNKEMRRKGGKANRRSSLGSRGRRASSLIDNGQTATPHRDVNPDEFYKHIAQGLPEPRRMKQLLMWCGERALPEKPRLGTHNPSAALGARAIQDQILKDFASRPDFSDWFSRDDEAPKPTVLKPNPRNTELDERLAALEAKIQRLQQEKEAWLAIREPQPDLPPLFAPSDAADAADTTDTAVELPDPSLLDPDEARIRALLADELVPFESLCTQTEERIRKIQASLEFEVDQLADNVHKLEQRVLAAGGQADAALGLGAARLREREQRDRTRAGTRDMPVMEVLRSLSAMLPEGGGG
ncbi:uncharacterized protein UV8b_07351 [Ustilaginoidea virens]|uniref:Mis12-Mtw1 family protein n=1 Tax=Ustilaginoidea virens TaxID=1159556 RepID=A0A8E5HWW2_USTVR|nr:uncharacterized protein UV8b_07351 [Ustilaginoidea virens]QUC23110.1 hypothetical protein UV8b_07351 [Ustilaginoidea virens]